MNPEEKIKKSERQKKWYLENREKILERRRKKYEENKEEFHQKQKEYREKNADSLHEYSRKYAKDNYHKYKEYYSDYYERNKEKILEYQKKRNLETKEERSEWQKWYNTTQNGRAHKLITGYNLSDKKYLRGKGDLTAQWIVENIFSKPCAHCGETDWHKLGCNRLDNTKPHTKDNVEPCCLKCNLSLPK